jgi:hypothetical protein
VPPDAIDELDSVYWFHGPDDQPTVRSIVGHLRLIQEVDPSYPIILGSDGRVMDGMHRVARALLEGRRTIPAVRFPPIRNRTTANCRPGDLPYPEP